jgi:hypothetical protein
MGGQQRRRTKEAPRLKKILQIGNDINLGDPCWWRSILEGASHDLQAMDDLVFCRERWDNAVGMMEFSYFGDDLALGVAFDQLEAAIRVQGGPDVEVYLGTVVPQMPGGRFDVDQDRTFHWSERGLVEIKGVVEELPRGDARVEGGLLQKIESELSL